MREIPCPFSRDTLVDLVTTQGLTDAQIAALAPGGSSHRVQAWRKRLGIPASPRWVRLVVPPIEGRLRSLLVGSMLGDGRLVRGTHTTRYVERHCAEQRAYLEWKAVHWGEWARPVADIPDKRGFLQVGMATRSHVLLNEWQELFYEAHDKGWKRLVPQIVDLVDPLALAIWYLDDGSVGWWPDITFGADEASRQVALAIFEKFGLHPRWHLQRGQTGVFHLEREDTAERFLALVRQHIPECMGYKMGPFGFQGPRCQARQRMLSAPLQEWVAEGVPVGEMARRLGVGATTVRRWLHRSVEVLR